jgi:hypothetical protein
MTITTTSSSIDQRITNRDPPIGSSAQNKLAIIFCAKNCEKTIGYAISSARKGISFSKVTA